ncbi:MAG: succinate dehydrogenase assembly factor 2 [Betaproteobacteria bacterium]|nr:succinate dehydrogenase assembly factor 2 [Betaproteobacteria bacterium]MDH3435754.1 succinate dehydrogenase assembly factor 2 [Betaproteobacteria bacterium]
MGDLDRIRWHCRRGLLELDLILARFMERHYENLDNEGRARFSELLERPDNDLLDWALGRGAPAEPRYQRVIELLRAS